ncbi:hypothetical protein RQP46_002505 [Phenoliferia psychrophenolica]
MCRILGTLPATVPTAPAAEPIVPTLYLLSDAPRMYFNQEHVSFALNDALHCALKLYSPADSSRTHGLLVLLTLDPSSSSVEESSPQVISTRVLRHQDLDGLLHSVGAGQANSGACAEVLAEAAESGTQCTVACQELNRQNHKPNCKDICKRRNAVEVGALAYPGISNMPERNHLTPFLERLTIELILASIAALDLGNPLATALQTHTIFASIQETGNSDPSLAFEILNVDVAPHAEALQRVYGRARNAFGQRITVDDLLRSGVVALLGMGAPPPSVIPVVIIFVNDTQPDIKQYKTHGVPVLIDLVEIVRKKGAARGDWRERLKERARVPDSVAYPEIPPGMNFKML